MRYLCAYLLAVLGGNESPTSDDIDRILASVSAQVEEDRVSALLEQTATQSIFTLMAEGLSRLRGAFPSRANHLTTDPAATTDLATKNLKDVLAPDLQFVLRGDSMIIGSDPTGSEHISIAFQRTLRIPDDGGTYPLPPGLGNFPLHLVSEFAERVPKSWLTEPNAVFFPMFQREACWFVFHGHGARPKMLKIGVGRVCAISGGEFSEEMTAGVAGLKQDYVVVPLQPWLDGINTGDGTVRQFIAMPMGKGYSIEAQVTKKEKHAGIQFCVIDSNLPPTPGGYGDEEDDDDGDFMGGGLFGADSSSDDESDEEVQELSMAAGGIMKQKIYDDPYPADAWNPMKKLTIHVHVVNSRSYRQITGREPPSTPVTSQTYADHHFPWYDLYDEKKKDVSPSVVLSDVKSVREIDEASGLPPQQDDTSVDVDGDVISLVMDED